jgi:hypothetical protein
MKTNARHEGVLVLKQTFHKCEKVQENEFEHFKMDFHFESWSFIGV